jgi:CCS family citrate carrier protein
MTATTDFPDIACSTTAQQRGWPYVWWRLLDIKIGIVPLPIYLILAGLIATFLALGKLPNEICMMIAVLSVCGFGCAELGKRLPVVRNIGAAAIFATFIPSALAFYHLLPEALLKSVADFTKQTNFLYLFIASIIVGSILGMDRNVLVRGFIKIFLPLALGSVVAGIVGTTIGWLLGMGVYRTFFFIVVPIMAGGVGEGAIPLSLGYSEILHQPQGELFAQVLPIVMLGSLAAILLSGFLNWVGERYPHLTGEGRLQPYIADEFEAEEEALGGKVDVGQVAAAGMIAITLYLLGMIAYHLMGLPGPVAMLFIAVIVKLTRAVSPELRQGANVVYKFFSTAVTYPLLFAIGVTMTPWDKLVAAFTLANLTVIFATVASLIGTGFVVARWVNMFPIDTAIVNACHSGQGGTGDVAILTAANRMQLMPFAQIATRIGGAITVTLSLILLSRLV